MGYMGYGLCYGYISISLFLYLLYTGLVVFCLVSCGVVH